jgi:hypothetical protein
LETVGIFIGLGECDNDAKNNKKTKDSQEVDMKKSIRFVALLVTTLLIAASAACSNKKEPDAQSDSPVVTAPDDVNEKSHDNENKLGFGQPKYDHKCQRA